MSGVYSMTSGPSYTGASRQDLFDSAMAQPLSLTSTLVDQAKGGILESFGLGTAVRNLVTPQGNEQGSVAEPLYGMAAVPIPGAYSLLKTGVQSMMDQGAPLTEDAYKGSASYRKDIPWDQGMTDTRAASLAAADDAKKVREYYATKRPFSSFIGNMAGQALDPVNYVPVFGEAVTAAAIGRFGYIGGRALVAGADAALNTGIAGAVTAGERGKFGDDVSWQGLISQMATAAMIGGAFGTLHGVFGGRVDPHAMSEAESRLSTLRTTQEARIALNEGIDAVAHGEDIKLSPNATEPMARVADAIRNEPPAPPSGISTEMASRLRDAGRSPAEADAAARLIDDFYATAAKRTGVSVDRLVNELGLPEVRGPNGDVKPVGAGRTLFQDEPRNLFVTHNIKPDGVLNASKIGGLPMPSLAVSRIDRGGFEGFGEISLITDHSIIDPKQDRNAKVYNADAYSPRYPSTVNDLDQKRFDAVNTSVVSAEKELGNTRERGLDQSAVEGRGGVTEARYSTGMKYLFVKEKGLDFTPVADWYENSKLLNALVDKHADDFADFVDAKMAGVVKRERIFKGFTSAGTRRYVDHTLANVFADMKARIKEGEGFNYGVGNIRSRFAKVYKDINGMRADREKIVTPEEVKKFKEYFDDRFLGLVEELKPYYRFDGDGFGYIDDTAAMIGEMATKGTRALNEGFKDLPDELVAKVRDFTGDLASAPTGYLEAKLTRTVGLDEFRAALVPTGTRKAVVDALKEKGIKIYEYDRSVAGSRAEALRKADSESTVPILFQSGKRGAIQFGDAGKTVISLFENADESTVLHETGHYFLNAFKGMAEKDGAPADIKADWQAVRDWWATNADAVAADAPGTTAADVHAVLSTGTTGDAAKDAAIDTGLHEQWARAFEGYLRDGVAPTEGLRGAFQQFKEWLTKIYKQARDLNVKITPEVRSVFDRMLGGEQKRSAIDTTPARPEPAAEGIKQAEASIAKPEDTKSLAEQYRVDPQTGTFPEEADLHQLSAEGRFTEHDAATMAEAQADYETGSAFAEALKSVAGCLI